jgi:hypothetical protein
MITLRKWLNLFRAAKTTTTTITSAAPDCQQHRYTPWKPFLTGVLTQRRHCIVCGWTDEKSI